MIDWHGWPWPSLSLCVVICLSDDDKDVILADDASTSGTALSPNKSQESSGSDKDPDKKDINDPSIWVISPKDMIRIPELPSKFSDVWRRPFEIRCSTVRFGVVEFSVDCDVVLMKDMEFEMRLRGKRSMSYDWDNMITSFRWFSGYIEHEVSLFRYGLFLLFISIRATGCFYRSSQGIRSALQSIHSQFRWSRQRFRSQF